MSCKDDCLGKETWGILSLQLSKTHQRQACCFSWSVKSSDAWLYSINLLKHRWSIALIVALCHDTLELVCSSSPLRLEPQFIATVNQQRIYCGIRTKLYKRFRVIKLKWGVKRIRPLSSEMWGFWLVSLTCYSIWQIILNNLNIT